MGQGMVVVMEAPRARSHERVERMALCVIAGVLHLGATQCVDEKHIANHPSSLHERRSTPAP